MAVILQSQYLTPSQMSDRLDNVYVNYIKC